MNDNQVWYIEMENLSVVRLITKKDALTQDLQNTIKYSNDWAYQAIMKYLNKTHQSKTCPYVPTFHNNNLYFVMKYDRGEWSNVNFDQLYNELEPIYQNMKKMMSGEWYTHLLDYIWLMVVLSDPWLDSEEFSLKMEKSLMEKKSDFIDHNRMWGAMLSNPKWGATRTSNTGKEENPLSNNIEHPFKVEWYNMIFYRKFHSGQSKRIPEWKTLEQNRSSAIKYGDIWSLRTPQDMFSFLSNNKRESSKAIPLFIKYLSTKIQEDIAYMKSIEEDDLSSKEIVAFFYEQYLMNLPKHCVHWIWSLLDSDFEAGKLMMIDYLKQSEKKYQSFVSPIRRFLKQEISYQKMIQEAWSQLKNNFNYSM